MVFINELFPNPVGADAAGEFIELYNDGRSNVILDNWKLSVGGKKDFSLSGYSVPARGYLILKKSQTKLSLKNTDGGLFLYGLNGSVVDQASFAGAAPEGKSFSRINNNTGPAQHFVFEDPTPGVQNKSFDTSVASKEYPFGISLAPQISPSSFLVLVVGVASTIVLLFLYLLIKNENLSHIIFGRDHPAR
jgi:hypothetical protein